MAGIVERSIRAAVTDGQHLSTPTGAAFTIGQLTPDALVLLLGAGEHRTPISWDCLEGIPALLRGKDWVLIGGKFTTKSDPETLDGYLKRYQKTVTAGWVAVVLEQSKVVDLDRGRPGRIRLRDGYGCPHS